MSSDYSALIITHNRDRHLVNTINGLLAQTQVPADIVVVFMNQSEEPILPHRNLVTTLHIESESTLPLAQARNTAAAYASNDVLMFLDVDCIPANDFGEVMLADVGRYGGLVMGTPRYLPAGWSNDDDLVKQSSTHPARAELQLGPSNEFNKFWSLCFAINAKDFRKVGGFDERFIGYGGEDTDFAWSVKSAGVPFALSSATVFHQFHESLRPPLNHFDDIIENAHQFHAKWRQWPMGAWLKRFESLGLISWNREINTLTILRRPSRDEIEAARTADLFA